MKVWRALTAVTHWLILCAGSFLLWTFWLLLVAIAVILIVIASSHELRVPARVVQAFRDRLAVAGLRVTFDSASFDPTGHVLIENLQVFGESFEEPLATCPSVFVRIDPWDLLVGTIRVDALRGHGLNFYVPPMLSASGRTEPVLSDVDFEIEPSQLGYEIRRLMARAGPLSISCHGQFERIITSPTPSKPGISLNSSALADYLHAAGQISLWQAKLSAFEKPTLHVLLTPDALQGAMAHITFLTPLAELNSSILPLPSFEKTVRVQDLRLETILPTGRLAHLHWHVAAKASRVDLGDGTAIRELALAISGQLQTKRLKISGLEAVAAAGDVSTPELTVHGVDLYANATNWPQIYIETSARIADEDWGIKAQGDPLKRAFNVSAVGRVSPEILALVSDKSGHDFTKLLTIPHPADFAAQAEFAPGAKFRRATAQFDARELVARDVRLTRAAAEVAYDGDTLDVENVILTQPGNQAQGSYWMDTKTLDYRFLLTGSLHPEGIAGWFHDWWPHFWSRFDFSQVAPNADIDIQGRWKEPHLSTIFVHVDATRPSVRTVHFDLVRTTLFIRPDFYDDLELYVTHGESVARGRFTRSVDVDDHDFRWMEFQVDSTFDIQEGARLFGDEGTDLVDAYVFARPPKLKLSGRLEGEDSPNGKHEDVSIAIDSSGDFRFFDFPLNDLHCTATVHDRTIEVKNLQVGFAGGVATGEAKVTGAGMKRHLSLETDLQGANLGVAINTLDQFGARSHGQIAKSLNRFQDRVASGKLDLHANAEGEYHNLLSFTGAGHAELRGAELGQINLLGSLSAALKGNSVLGFTSWDLNTARAIFTLDHDKLLLPEFHITGTTAKIDAHGSYSLAAKTIDISAKFYPFEEGKTLLANAVGFVLTPVSAALELKLSGSLSKPKWFFEYGPTNLFRKLAGADKNDATANPAEPAPLEEKIPDYQPPPYLRR